MLVCKVEKTKEGNLTFVIDGDSTYIKSNANIESNANKKTKKQTNPELRDYIEKTINYVGEQFDNQKNNNN